MCNKLYLFLFLIPFSGNCFGQKEIIDRINLLVDTKNKKEFQNLFKDSSKYHEGNYNGYRLYRDLENQKKLKLIFNYQKVKHDKAIVVCNENEIVFCLKKQSDNWFIEGVLTAKEFLLSEYYLNNKIELPYTLKKLKSDKQLDSLGSQLCKEYKADIKKFDSKYVITANNKPLQDLLFIYKKKLEEFTDISLVQTYYDNNLSRGIIKYIASTNNPEETIEIVMFFKKNASEYEYYETNGAFSIANFLK